MLNSSHWHKPVQTLFRFVSMSSRKSISNPLKTVQPIEIIDSDSDESVDANNRTRSLIKEKRMGLKKVLSEIDDTNKIIKYHKNMLFSLKNKATTLSAEIEALELDLSGTLQSIDWNSEKFSWSEEARKIKSTVFGIHGPYRSCQLSAINATLSGHDVFLVMPTGSGKSLCFQVPSIVDKGRLTLVISPLIALMKDQTNQLYAGYKSALLSSDTTKDKVKLIYGQIEEGSLNTLYVTPERISKSKLFLSKLEKLHAVNKLARIVVDEAHCCSEWGHDFRLDYAKLRILKTQFENVPVICMTATATTRVEMDVKQMLKIKSALTFKADLRRANIEFDVRYKSNCEREVFDNIADFILKEFPASSAGIVYCFSRKDTEVVSIALNERGISACCYHAGQDLDTRSTAQSMWSKGARRVICATVAFGLGINKLDVRFVIHHTVPSSIENYLQESGRGGRDGKSCTSTVYYRRADIPKIAGLKWDQRLGSENCFRIARYCEMDLTSKQRSDYLLQHLQCCEMPQKNKYDKDNEIDITTSVHAFLLICERVKLAGKNKTFTQMIDLYQGRGRSGLNLSDVDKAPCYYQRDFLEKILMYMLLNSEFGIFFYFRHSAYATNTYIGTHALNSSKFDEVLMNVSERDFDMIENRKKEIKKCSKSTSKRKRNQVA